MGKNTTFATKTLLLSACVPVFRITPLVSAHHHCPRGLSFLPVTPTLFFLLSPSPLRPPCLKSKLPSSSSESSGRYWSTNKEEEWVEAAREDACRDFLNRRVYFCLSRRIIIGCSFPGYAGRNDGWWAQEAETGGGKGSKGGV